MPMSLVWFLGGVLMGVTLTILFILWISERVSPYPKKERP